MPRNTRRRIRYNEVLARPDVDVSAGAAAVAERLSELSSAGFLVFNEGNFLTREITTDGDGLRLEHRDGVTGNPRLSLSHDLQALEALNTFGIAVRRAPDEWVTRRLAPPAAGLTIANQYGVDGDFTFALADDLAALEALGSTGFAVRTAANAWAQRSLAEPAAGLTIANPAGIAGNPTFALANDLAALEGLVGTGYARRTGVDAWALATTVPWSDISGTPTTLAGYGITDAQPLDADLTAIAALATAAGGRSLLTLAATASRLVAFDGSSNPALVNFETGSFTPTFNFATPGDLSVAYTVQQGYYQRLGQLVFVALRMVFTPTHTTASGIARVEGLPFQAVSSATLTVAGFSAFSTGSAVTFPAGTTSAIASVNGGDQFATISTFGSGTGGTQWGTGQFPTATARVVTLTFWYVV